MLFRSALANNHSRYIVSEHSQKYGNRGSVFWFAPVVVRDYFARKFKVAPGTGAAPTQKQCDALERLQTARAEREEMRLAVERKQLIPKHEALETFHVLAEVLKRRVDQLQKRYGPEAAQWFEEALQEAEQMFEERMNDSDDSLHAGD